MTAPSQADLQLELPGGTVMRLHSVEEVELIEASAKQYMSDYDFDKLNDRVLLGALLTQQLGLYRAQQKLSGMEPQFDSDGTPQGTYKFRNLKPAEQQAAGRAITEHSDQIMNLEKTLGIDKKTREAGGEHTLAKYLATLKRAGHAMGVHITNRTKLYEGFVADLRVRIRMLDNLDSEDKAYHSITNKSIIDFCRDKVGEFEEKDKEFAKEKGHLWIGKL